MVQLGKFLPLQFLLNPEKTMHDDVKKVQELAKKTIRSSSR